MSAPLDEMRRARAAATRRKQAVRILRHAAGVEPTSRIAAQWRTGILAWFRTWPKRGLVMPSGRTRSRVDLLAACMGVADMARSDGSLKAAFGDWWSIKQLAPVMGMSYNTAKETLEWLEATGLLKRTPGLPSAEGRGTDIRRLTMTGAIHQQSSSALMQPQRQGSSSTLTQPQHQKAGSPTSKSGEPNINAKSEPNINAEIEPCRTPRIPRITRTPRISRQESPAALAVVLVAVPESRGGLPGNWESLSPKQRKAAEDKLDADHFAELDARSQR